MQKSINNSVARIKNLIIPFFVFVIINLATYSAYQITLEHEKEHQQDEFSYSSERYFNLFTQMMNSKLNTARALKAYFQGSSHVDRTEFKIFTQIILKANPDIQALNWLPKITGEQRSDYETRLRSEGFEQFSIKKRTADNQLLPSPVKDIYFPIEYIEPFNENKVILGLDSSSIPEAAQAINKLVIQQEFSISKPFSLTQNSRQHNSVSIFFPVFNEQRLVGLVELVLRLDKTLKNIHDKFKFNDYILLEIKDITDGKENYLYRSNDLSTELDNRLYDEHILTIGGQQWKASFYPSARLLDSNHIRISGDFKAYILRGPLLSLLIAALLFYILNQKATTEILVSRLKGSESRFRQLIRHSADAHYLYDEHGKVLQVNNRSCKEVGYSREELLQLSLFDISNTKSQQIEEILSSFKLGEVRTIDGEHIHKNGSVIPVEVSISYFMLDDKPVFSTFSRNISQRKIQEKQLKESETRLKQSEEIAHFGSWALNISNQKLIWSDEVFNIMGIDPSTKLNYEVFLNTIHPEDRERVNTTYLESVKEGYMYIVDYRIIMANGQLKYVHEQGRTDYDETGQPLRSYGYVQDITLQKNQELKLVELQRRADFANKTKSEFLANMSHELRTPMHGILSFASIGMKKYESATREKLQQYFSNIQVSGERLLLLLNNLLDLSKLEAGKMILNKKLTNLNKVFDSCYQEQEQRMKDLDLTLKFSDDTNKAASGIFDQETIGQVITNILSNAIKFSPRGANISVSITEEMNSQIQFSLLDEGEGIPEDELESIFDAFAQSSKTNTGAGGTGLGLAISREIIAAHNGKIWAKNNPGGGSIFSFTIPGQNH